MCVDRHNRIKIKARELKEKEIRQKSCLTFKSTTNENEMRFECDKPQHHSRGILNKYFFFIVFLFCLLYITSKWWWQKISHVYIKCFWTWMSSVQNFLANDEENNSMYRAWWKIKKLFSILL